jgi:hypothetical protein
MFGILDDEQIEDLLSTSSVGHIGCRDGDEMYVVPVSYAYADGNVYGHCVEGRKLTAMRRDPQVGFEVEDVRGIGEWRSVVATGRFEELHGDEARTALDLLHRRLAPDEPVAAVHGHGTSRPPVLFRIRLLSRSGRYERPSRGGRIAARPSSTVDRPRQPDTLARLMCVLGK